MPLTEHRRSQQIIGAAMEVQRNLRPGLLVSCYAECLAKELARWGLRFERERVLPFVHKDLKLDCGYRDAFLVEQRVNVERKAIETLTPIHRAVVLTYLRRYGCKQGATPQKAEKKWQSGRYAW